MNRASNPDVLKLARWALLVAVLLLPPLVFENRGYYLRIATLVLMFAGLGGAWNIIGGFANQVSLGSHLLYYQGVTRRAVPVRYATDPGLLRIVDHGSAPLDLYGMD